MLRSRVVEFVRVPGIVIRVPDEDAFGRARIRFGCNLSAVGHIGYPAKGLQKIDDFGHGFSPKPSSPRPWEGVPKFGHGVVGFRQQ